MPDKFTFKVFTECRRQAVIIITESVILTRVITECAEAWGASCSLKLSMTTAIFPILAESCRGIRTQSSMCL